MKDKLQKIESAVKLFDGIKKEIYENYECKSRCDYKDLDRGHVNLSFWKESHEKELLKMSIQLSSGNMTWAGEVHEKSIPCPENPDYFFEDDPIEYTGVRTYKKQTKDIAIYVRTFVGANFEAMIDLKEAVDYFKPAKISIEKLESGESKISLSMLTSSGIL